MRVITCSRHFPKGHPKEGQPTWFVENILNSINHGKTSQEILDGLKPEVKEYVNDFAFLTGASKHHTIRSGSRWKVGDMASLRIWSGAPRRSKQVEFAQVEVKKIWKVEIKFINGAIGIKINGVEMKGVAGPCIAKNDGLEWLDFVQWFNVHPKKKLQVFSGQIICWSNEVTY